MDKKLQLLLHIFGDVESPEALDMLLRDEALQAEYRRLGEVSRALEVCHELRPVQAPDPSVVSRVLDEAASRHRFRLVPGLRGSAPRVRVMRRTAWSSLALAAAVGGIIFWSRGSAEQPSNDTSIQALSATEQVSQSAEIPPWDEGAQLVNVHSYIEILRARSEGEDWDEPEVLKIDSLPVPAPNRGLVSVGASQ